MYSPEAHGALCYECPLHGRTVVPPEINSFAKIVIVAEAPGKSEEEAGRPLVGPSGKEVSIALIANGCRRGDVSLTNSLLCRPPGRNLKVYSARLRAENRRRHARGEALLLHPLTCCRPRLMAELTQADSLLLLGAAAVQSVGEKTSEKGLMETRGYPGSVVISGRSVPALSTIHPAFALRSRRWLPVFRSDVSKAIRMATGTLDYRLPELLYDLPPARLSAFLDELDESGDLVAADVETDGLEPLTARLRCIGIGNKDRATSVRVRSVEDNGKLRFDWEEYEEILAEWFTRPGIVAMHNGQYDKTVLTYSGDDGCRDFRQLKINRRLFDTMAIHHVIWSEHRHDLGFVISQYTDAPAHKVKDHDSWTSDAELHRYNMLDVAGTADVGEHMLRDPSLVVQKKAVKADQFLSEFCRQLHIIGIRLDLDDHMVKAEELGGEPALLELCTLYERQGNQQQLRKVQDRIKARRSDPAAMAGGKVGQATTRFREQAVAVLPSDAAAELVELTRDINPNSRPQVCQLLYDTLGIQTVPEEAGGLTDTGERKMDRAAVLYLIDRGLPSDIEELMQRFLDYVMVTKKLQDTQRFVEWTLADSRIHPHWNPHTVVSGRLSTSDPGVQNVDSKLRTIFVAENGHVFINCDKMQLELRLCAWLAQDQELIEAFLAGGDVHQINTAAMLKKPIDQVTPGERKFGKNFTFAVQYGAGARKVWQMLRNFRDRDGSRPYRQLRLSEVEVSHRLWWKARSAVAQYHENNRIFWRENGYLADELDGRWRRFLDGSENAEGEVKEQMANYPIQATAAADVNAATRRVVEAYPWGFAGPHTGVVHQCHDALLLEVPAADAERIGRHVVELMHSQIGDMPLPVDLAIGPSWGSLKKFDLAA